MSKRFKGKPCVYCGSDGGTADHIFAREFFPTNLRANLPKVSACRPCNVSKSELEHYLLTLLPFGGRLPISNSLMSAAVPGRLAKNRRLHAELATGQSSIEVKESGGVRRAMALPFDNAKLVALFRSIARGLAAYHWNAAIPQNYYVGAGLVTEAGEAVLRPLFLLNARQAVQESLGKGLILYEGVQGVDNPSLTIWRFQIYGGVVLGGDPDAPDITASDIWAITSPRPIPGLFDG